MGDGISKFDHQIHAQNLNWSSCVSDINLHGLGRCSRFLIYLMFLADRYKNIILSLYDIFILFILQKKKKKKQMLKKMWSVATVPVSSTNSLK